MTMQQFCLRWNNHQPNFISVFSSLLNSESLVDVTLAAEGRHLQAHKVVLSACSSYFQTLFKVNPCQHPIVILKDVKFIDLKVMVDFMYYGEVNVSQEQLPHILKTAEMLKIKGLAENPDSTSLTKSQSGSAERTELLTPGDSNWSSDQRRSLSPSPCPLSPASRRKRLRKSSTGSGSGSTERTTSEEHPNDATLTSPGGSIVIKPDPGGFASDGSVQHKNSKQHSTDSEPQRDSSQESVEEPQHQITLQIPQQEAGIAHSVEPPIEVAGPSSATGSVVPGLQWTLVEHQYPRYTLTTCQTNFSLPDSQYSTAGAPVSCAVAPSGPVSPCPSTCPSPCASPVQIQNQQQQQQQQGQQNMQPKRKRSLNPQGEENFIRALEAVRFGGIGFCKAARMYGVNNRTLWLEYKKRGYPISRTSIKNRVKSEFFPPRNTSPSSSSNMEQQPPLNQAQITMSPPTHSVAMVAPSFMEGGPVDFSPTVQRPRFSEGTIGAVQQQQQQQQQLQQQHISFGDSIGTPQSHINLAGINFSQIGSSYGGKRGRLLMRQPRIKKEIDPSQPSPEGEPSSSFFLSVPSARVERQISEPLPSHSPPPLSVLHVPGSLVKQHSQPLLPSQTQHSVVSTPLHVRLTPSTSGEAERAISPIVIVTDPLVTSDIALRADSAVTGTAATLRVRTDELKRSVSSPQTGSPRSSHCPVVRPGPALGCNFCWNTVDGHGRILRRKTKYHCPECQTNLCIVPCFQEYHERHGSGGTGHDPIALTSSVMRIFPKTSSM